MIRIIEILVAIPILIFMGLFLLRVRSKKLLIGIPIAVFCLPLVCGFGIYLARTPIQQGMFLADIGPLLSLISPPNDLYKPLAEETLSPDKATYIFSISHKYVGNHGISIIVPSPNGPDFKNRGPLAVSTRFLRGQRLVIEKPKENGSQYWGNNEYGFDYNYYSVPRDLPVSEPLTVEITINGDIATFLKENKAAKVAVKKMSDE